MKIGIVADIHCGPDAGSNLGSRAPMMLDRFAEAMDGFGPDCIVDLGDRINDVASGQDRVRTIWVRRTLGGLGLPVHHLMGNHDLVNLTKAEVSGALEKACAYEHVDREGMRLVFLDSLDPPLEGIGGAIGVSQRTWLETVIGGTTQPCLVFSHHPLDEQALDGHEYFADHPEHALVHGRAAVRRIIERSGNVLAVFSGHIHRTCATAIEGIPYVTLGSLVDGARTNGRPCGTFAEVTISAEFLDVRVHGLLAERFRYLRPAGE